MNLCELLDCDCNVEGFCTDWFAHIKKNLSTSNVVNSSDCMGYNPVDKGGDDE